MIEQLKAYIYCGIYRFENHYAFFRSILLLLSLFILRLRLTMRLFSVISFEYSKNLQRFMLSIYYFYVFQNYMRTILQNRRTGSGECLLLSDTGGGRNSGKLLQLINQ